MSARPSLIPQAAPGRVYEAYRTQIDSALTEVLQSGAYVLAEQVRQFELEFAAHVGIPHAIGVANGTDALELALRGCGVTQGDLVFAPSFAPSATAAAVVRAGARLVLLDIDPDTLQLDPVCLAKAMVACGGTGVRCGAIVAVHLFGAAAPIGEIVEIGRDHGVPVIEDCCQAHGTIVDGRHVGNFGRAAAFSFYPTKNLACFGDGGMVVTRDSDLADQVLSSRQYGWHTRYDSEHFGVNSRLDEIQAAILRVMLPELEARNERRRRIAAQYLAAVSNTSFQLQHTSGERSHNWHQFVIIAEQRAALRHWLASAGVDTSVHYPVPLHRQRAFRDAFVPFPLTVSEYVAEHIVSTPIFPELHDAEVATVVRALEQCAAVVTPKAV